MSEVIEMAVSDEMLDKILISSDLATPLPWDEVAESSDWWITGPDLDEDFVMSSLPEHISQEDINYILIAANSAPAMAREIRRLRNELAAKE